MKRYFEKLYEGAICKWGDKPDFILMHFLDLFPKGPVLDIGMGEGRNALFFAEKGFGVEGIDISKKAVDKCLRLAEKRKVHIKAYAVDMRDFEIPEEKFSLIIATGASLNFLRQSEMKEIVAKIRKGVKIGGYVYVSVVSTDESICKKLEAEQTPIEENTFYVSKVGGYVHYFTYEEIRELFQDFETIIHLGGQQLDFHDKPHYHGILYYLGKRTS